MINFACKSVVAAAAAAGILTGAQGAFAAGADYMDSIRGDVVPEVREWASSPAVVEAVRRQNDKHARLTAAEIETLDRTWRKETQAVSRPMIDEVLGNELSAYLQKVQADARGLYTEIFVMDNKGLNVGQSNLTSDYWQGDEDKWRKTYLAGADSVMIDAVEFDESTQTFQSQLSLPVVDPVSSEVIGAVTVGINVDLFQ